jgi:hypothetical protein
MALGVGPCEVAPSIGSSGSGPPSRQGDRRTLRAGADSRGRQGREGKGRAPHPGGRTLRSDRILPASLWRRIWRQACRADENGTKGGSGATSGDAVSAGVSPGSAGSLVRRRIADVRCGSHVPGDVSKQHQTMQRLDALVALRDSPTLPAPSLTGRSGRCTQARVVARRGSLPARSVGWRRLSKHSKHSKHPDG